MIPWWWLIVAFLGGAAAVAVPVAAYAMGWIKNWDRAWGYRD